MTCYIFLQELVTAITWGHCDQKLFVATKNLLHVMNISREIPSLQSLCQAMIAGSLQGREESFNLVLPTKLKVAVAGCFDPLIQVCTIKTVVKDVGYITWLVSFEVETGPFCVVGRSNVECVSQRKGRGDNLWL